MTKEELKKRTKLFAIRVFKFIDGLPKAKSSDVITYQVLKFSSSVALNYRAVGRGKSEGDFLNKLKLLMRKRMKHYSGSSLLMNWKLNVIRKNFILL